MTYAIRKIEMSTLPEALFEIPEPPKSLFMAGTLPHKNTVFLSVVGSRKVSRYGKEACETLISGLEGYPIAIVSGLALGVDTVAHYSALAAHLPTIAFPGSGLSPTAIYPKTNFSLVEKIIENGGALLSEFENDFLATPWSFPKRNRLMAGFSKATLVIEAGEKSGTLITARLALDYNRDVYAVPHSIFSSNAKGVNALLRQGATPVTCAEDILDALGFELTTSKNKSVLDTTAFSKSEMHIWQLLSEARPKDEIMRSAELPTHETSTILMRFELQGYIKEDMGEVRRVV